MTVRTLRHSGKHARRVLPQQSILIVAVTPSINEENAISRIFAAIIAVAAFEFALFFALYAISGRRQVFQAMFGAPGWFHLLIVAAACASGWFGGLQGLNWLYQHMSYRHASNHRNPVLTGALWCLLLLVAAAARALAE